ncbi:hypothetical protein [Glycomyces sp. YM15]|uniref:hypothetical protein n=1 Tax=Glycomyces sp. YM15 TaxID=2800446 RepID=UPI00196442C3|nr:hypothetical protein [Glycomyces sp. YM15]
MDAGEASGEGDGDLEAGELSAGAGVDDFAEGDVMRCAGPVGVEDGCLGEGGLVAVHGGEEEPDGRVRREDGL